MTPAAQPNIEVQVVRVVETRGGKTSVGEIQIQSWDKRERTRRALKVGALCWGGAIFAVILPLVHFVLVPGLLAAGPIMVFILLGQERMVIGGKAACPQCGADLPIARTAYRFPIDDLCTACKCAVKINPV